MKPVILLIDLQNDFLCSLYLEPAPGGMIDRVARLVNAARELSIPVVHIWTTVSPKNDSRMPHWKLMNKWSCVEGTEGHATPEPLRPLTSENIIHKTFFSAFSDSALEGVLRSLEAETLVLAGVHLHGCIRATALDAYQRGFRIWIAEDAVASDDPLHAAITRRYLEQRSLRFLPVEMIISSFHKSAVTTGECRDLTNSLPSAIIADSVLRDTHLEHMVHFSPRQNGEICWSVSVCGAEQASRAAKTARKAWSGWKDSSMTARVEVLERFAGLLTGEADALAEQMAREIGKPVMYGRAEVFRTAALLKDLMRRADDPLEIRCGPDSVVRYRPLGLIAIVTPWNNPLAIPIGKIAPALFYGNTVVWKPAPASSSLAIKTMELLRASGCPAGAVNLICGDRSTAEALMADPEVDAATLSGSLSAGYSAQDICTARHIPLQAELGGNNAAVVWSDCDIEKAASRIAEAAFGFAGQRCTANRRAVVDTRCYDKFLKYLLQAVSALVWGDPLDHRTQVGPLISLDKCSRIGDIVERARASGGIVFIPHAAAADYAGLTRRGAYFPPVVICCDNPRNEVVQEETFGPVLVIQRANDWTRAMELCNGVKQGLAAALFSDSQEIIKRFLEEAQAGILKINAATADANAEAPFGGWKASGIGPPEHGESDREFYTRAQSVYKGLPE
jgi:acyl-CoA reductase-like NAD-dependent aldehyde dehydrogenase/nicotinamidase-related amidase